MTFQKATKTQARVRLALNGPAGSGKTYTALLIARGLGGRIAVIDTEHGSASKYADEFDFDVMELDSFSPKVYVSAINAAVEGGYNVLSIDSLTHEWTGPDGALEMIDRSRSENKFAAWADVTPLHNRLIDTILGAPIHVIATMRAKMQYVVEKDNQGKQVPRKVGMGPIQRDGTEFEFDVVAELNQDHRLTVVKTRCKELDGVSFDEPGQNVAEVLLRWVGQGEPDAWDPIHRAMKEIGWSRKDLSEFIHAKYPDTPPAELSAVQLADIEKALKQELNKKLAAAEV